MRNTNPYRASAAYAVAGDGVERVANARRVPIRLRIGVLGFPLFVFLTLPFYGIANSTSRADRVEGCLDGLLWFAPLFVVLLTICVSAFRIERISPSARIMSVLLFVAYAVYGSWLFPMMLRGPIRGF
ncbi:MAG: hypothetical protein AAGG48_30015 [Planctomycetota bacterium]